MSAESPSRVGVLLLALLLGAGLFSACGGGSTGEVPGLGDDGGEDGEGQGGTEPPPGGGPASTATVLAANDLGMHCMDREYSVFSMLPPFNVVHAQVVGRDSSGRPFLMDDREVDVTYEATTDASGSRNSTSVDKTDFWIWTADLYGPLASGMGLKGFAMPADAVTPGPQPLLWESSHGWFTIDGLPITPTDDANQTNPYPLMRIRAWARGTSTVVGAVDVVLPVSQETNCQGCHTTGAIGTRDGSIAWATDADPEVQTKKNILMLHDARHGTGLAAATPVLCASCHYSAALDLEDRGPQGVQTALPAFSHALHGAHARLELTPGSPLFPPDGTAQQTCYQCHPGAVTKCQRGAMRTGGMECVDCHGGLQAVAGATPLVPGGSIDGTNDGQPRRPWLDLPRCQSCHTGDALRHLAGAGLVAAADGIRLRQAWRTTDASASPVASPGSRFAENANTLYRFSRGHGGIACIGCHGSTHAIWPNEDATANDNVAAVQIQGHAGTIVECSACHGPGSLPLTTQGPHGLHNVNDPRWVDERHGDFFEASPDDCRACHGANLEGTVLSRAAATRTFRVEGRTVTLPEGTPIGCNHCHGTPGAGGDDD